MTVDEEVVMSAHRYRKVALVWAERTTTSGRIETPEGVMEYAAGDYLVADSPPTHIWPVRRDIFERTYEPVAPSAVALERELEEFADVRARFSEPDD